MVKNGSYNACVLSGTIMFDVYMPNLCLSEEEINNMKIELEKYNIQMPAFSKIGGILANELSVDEAACEHLLILRSNDQV